MLFDVNNSNASAVNESLNPCSSGICSLTSEAKKVWVLTCEVLILVLVEYAL